MTKSSVKKTLAQAKDMGLELSPDGKSWVPIEELVVRLPPDKYKKVRISVIKEKEYSTWTRWIFPIVSVASVLVIIVSLIAAWWILNIILGVAAFFFG